MLKNGKQLKYMEEKKTKPKEQNYLEGFQQMERIVQKKSDP